MPSPKGKAVGTNEMDVDRTNLAMSDEFEMVMLQIA